MKRLMSSALVILMVVGCSATKYLGQVKITQTRMEPIAVTTVKIDGLIMKVYGRCSPSVGDSVFIQTVKGKDFVKFSSSEELYLVKEE